MPVSSLASYNTLFTFTDEYNYGTSKDIEDTYSATKTLRNKTINCNKESSIGNTITNASVVSAFYVNFDDAPSIELMELSNLIVENVYVYVLTDWDGTQTNNLFEIGDDDDSNGFITDLGGGGANVLSTTGFKTEEICARGGSYLYPASCGGAKIKYYGSLVKKLKATLTKDASCTQGKALIYVHYIKLA